MLTQKQRDLLIMIHEHTQQDGVAPSFDEMRESIGLKSKSGIHRLVSALVERGFLLRLPNRARAIQVQKLPDGYIPKHPREPFVDLQPGQNDNISNDSATESIPLYGKIAAGTPIEAIRHEGQHVDIPASLLGAGQYYALTIEGDSMIGAGIFDSDTVVIERQDTARNGDIVVALVDGQEATLKEFKRESDKIALVPKNPSHDVRILNADRVQIQGKLISLYRNYG